MDIQTLINTVLPLICVAMGWFCKELWNAVQDLKNDLNSLRTHLAENYVHKEDFSDRWEEVLKAVHRIEDKLDNLRNHQ
jgi:predicted nuclease with TOPRIM domain